MSFPDAKNVELVRRLNSLLMSNPPKNVALMAIKLRARVLKLQGTPMSDTGLPYVMALQLLADIDARTK